MQNEKISIGPLELLTLLPHRYPFLLIDKVTELEFFKKIVAVKNVTFSEPHFTGHFPENPIMPGVLIIESMAQAAGVLGVKSYLHSKNISSITTPPDVLLVAVDDVRFRSIVRPGDTMIINVLMEKSRNDISIFTAESFVDEKKVCEAKITAKLIFKDKL